MALASSEGLVVAVVGATGAVGEDLVRTLVRSTLPMRELRLLASRSNQVSSIDVGERPLRVHVMPEDPLHSALFEGVDLVFFATPAEVAQAHGAALAAHGIAVIDIGGALAEAAPLVVPAVSTEPLARFRELRVVCSPSGPAVLLGTTLAPLLPLGLTACRATVLVSAGMAGREGVAELSGQVVALFNSRDPPRKVFPAGLAFDLLPQVDDAVDDSGWTGLERRVVTEVAHVLSMEPTNLAVTLAMVPLFTGVSASMHAVLEPQPDLDTVRVALAGGASLRFGDPVPGPRRVAGKAGVFVGRLRRDPLGEGVHLWATADNLRMCASANALSIAQALLDEGML